MNLLAACTPPMSVFCGSGPVNNTELTVYTAIFWASVVLGVFVVGMLLYAFFRFRRKHDDEEPEQIHGNSRLEVGWTTTPFVILFGLFILSAVGLLFINDVGASPKAAQAVNVGVEGEQFAWIATYPNGQTSVGYLFVPVATPVNLTLTAKDVIHSLYIPGLMGQRNAVPGQSNNAWLEADQAGVWYGQCTELCGWGHYNMKIQIVALNYPDYNACVNSGKAINPSSAACTKSGGTGT